MRRKRRNSAFGQTDEAGRRPTTELRDRLSVTLGKAVLLVVSLVAAVGADYWYSVHRRVRRTLPSRWAGFLEVAVAVAVLPEALLALLAETGMQAESVRSG